MSHPTLALAALALVAGFAAEGQAATRPPQVVGSTAGSGPRGSVLAGRDPPGEDARRIGTPASGGTAATATAAVTRPPPPAPVGGEEEDEPDPMLASGAPLAPWTDNQRRPIHHWFLPGAAALPSGDWYYRISHVAREGYRDEPRTNLLGLDDNVKIGLLIAWAPVRACTLSLQRVNGRDLAVPPQDGEAVQYDTYELLGQVQLLDQRGVRGLFMAPCDLSVVVGGSWMPRNHGTGDLSIDLGVVAERDLFADRLRLGAGLWRAGLSAYDAAIGIGPADKPFPDEPGAAESGTTAAGATARIALSQHWFLLGEMVQPLAGWKTGRGPAMAAGIGYDTNTHEFAIYLANSANAAFNGVLTGGAQERALPFFAFSVTAYP